MPVWILLCTSGVSCSHYASVEAEDVDVDRLLRIQVDSDVSLQVRFPDFAVKVSKGIQKSTGKRRRDGIRDLLVKDFSGSDDEAGRSWTAHTSVFRFVDRGAAAKYIQATCEFYGKHFEPSHIASSEEGPNEYCSSGTARLRNDPEGLLLPSNSYSSFTIVRNADLVVQLNERRLGGAGTARNAVIEEITQEY